MYKKQYKSRRDGPRYYGYLVSQKKEFSDLTLRNDMYLINHQKLNVMSFNRGPRQEKNYESMKKDEHITIEKVVEPPPEKDAVKETKKGNKKVAKKASKKNVESKTKITEAKWVVKLTNHSEKNIMVDREQIAPNGSCELTSFQRIALENEDNLLFLFVDSRPSDMKENPRQINEKYRMKECIGYGYTGNVFYSFSMDRMQACALKRVNKDKFKEYDGLDCIDELDMLKGLTHPNIIELFNYHDTDNYLYLELEYARGGNLFDRLYDEDYGHSLNEFQAKCVMYQMVSAVAYMHRMGVTHRDIKPENMLLMSRDEIPLCKLADFGTSYLGNDKEGMTSTACTVEHAAPEILKLKNGISEESFYTSKVDCWSLGVVIYESLCARQPFYEDPDDSNTIESKIYSSTFQFYPEDWDPLTEHPKNLVTGLLQPDVATRLTAQQALDHKWFEDEELKKTYAALTSQWRQGVRQLAEYNL